LRPIAVLALAVCGIVIVAAARAISAPPIPDSRYPAWLDDVTIRFQSNFEWYRTPQNYQLVPYVMAADGGAVRPATNAEAQQAPASTSTGETLVFGSSSVGWPLFLVDTRGRRRLLEASAYEPAQAALSPDGNTAVFAAWIGHHNAESVVLYAVSTDGSSEPRRLTPTSCTGSTSGPPGGACYDGTDGPDRFVGTKYRDLAITGSGDDTIRAGDGMNWIESQWGDDDIRSGSGVDSVLAGSGEDVIHSGGRRDYINLGPGHDRVFAGAGPDALVANDGQRDVIDCGSGDDRARVDRFDVTRNCEHIKVAPPFRYP